ncbi:hypothetical protein [Rhizorhabdus histidinilytica]|uniref:hypothetical protein n=1 Tax=Rhizorhabdus histidinilytica TaxID=439228 RepID=UPI00063F6B63|nr:hypothetical protein [Sphingomonas sp. Y57]
MRNDQSPETITDELALKERLMVEIAYCRHVSLPASEEAERILAMFAQVGAGGVDFIALARRFVTWPLPRTVCADLCATDPNYQYGRSGTNLLSLAEAEQMLRHVLGSGCACHPEVQKDASRHGSCLSGGCPHVGREGK